MSEKLSHEDFVKLLNQGKLAVRAHLSSSMHVCDRNHKIPKTKRAAHQFWKFILMCCLIGGVVSFFYIKWFYALGIVFLGVFLSKAIQKSAGEFVMETAIEDAEFYYQMVDGGVLLVENK